QDEGGRKQQGVTGENPPTSRHDEPEESLQRLWGRPVHGSHSLPHAVVPVMSRSSSPATGFLPPQGIGAILAAGVFMQPRSDVPERPFRRWSVWTLAILALLLACGLAICLYLTRFHENAMYGDSSVELANCPEDETTNCEAVNTSGYSELGGVPISAFGIPT